MKMQDRKNPESACFTESQYCWKVEGSLEVHHNTTVDVIPIRYIIPGMFVNTGSKMQSKSTRYFKTETKLI